jgi:hypothetical protein
MRSTTLGVMMMPGRRRCPRSGTQGGNPHLDWENINAIIEEGEQGKIVEVEDEVDHKTVEVWVE